MKEGWKLQDAKARFSELVNLAMEEGPQRVTRHGRSAVVVIAEAEYLALTREKLEGRKSLVQLVRECPAPEIFDDLEDERRKTDFGRTTPDLDG